MKDNMRKIEFLAAVLAAGVWGVRAAVTEEIAGYKTLTDCRVEFATVKCSDHLAATISSATLLNGATNATIPSVLMHSDEYGDVVVESVGDGALASCTALRELTLPDSVTNLAADVFAPCTALTKVKLNGASPTGLAASGIGARDVYYIRTPGESVSVPGTYASAATFASALNAGTAQKADCLKAPGGVSTSAKYLSYFKAVPAETSVRFVLNAEGSNEVTKAVKAVGTNALAVAFSASSTTLAVPDPLPGFYYSLRQGTSLTNLVFKNDAHRNRLGGRDAVSFTLEKPSGSGFYQTIVTPAALDE